MVPRDTTEVAQAVDRGDHLADLIGLAAAARQGPAALQPLEAGRVDLVLGSREFIERLEELS